MDGNDLLISDNITNNSGTMIPQIDHHNNTLMSNCTDFGNATGFDCCNAAGIDCSDEKIKLHPMSGGVAALVCILTAILSLLTIAGNAMVITAIRINKKLQTITNDFIFSLACADIIIGLISMNLFTTYVVQGGWMQGPALCDFWLTVDYVASNASVMNLVIISLDRYLAITKPLSYRANRTKARVRMMIAAAWIISFLLWAPAIILYPIIEGRQVPEYECYIQFIYTDQLVTFGTAMFAFYIPTAVMIYLNWRVYRENVEHQKYRRAFQASSKWQALRRNQSGMRARNSKANAKSSESTNFTQSKNGGGVNKTSQTSKNERGEAVSIKVSLASPDKKLANNPEEEISNIHQSDLSEDLQNDEERFLCEDEEEDTPVKHSDHYDLLSEVITQALKNGVKNSKTLENVMITSGSNDVMKSIRYDGLSVKVTSSQKRDSDATSEESEEPTDVRTPFLALAMSNALGVEGLALHSSTNVSPAVTPKSSSPVVDKAERGNSRSDVGFCEPQLYSFPNDSNKNVSESKPLNSNQPRVSDIASLFVATSKQVRNRISAVSKKDNKAARMLAAIIMAFVITWLPYNILVLVSTLCEDCVGDAIWKLSYYLCYLNSTINPVCYALCSAEFRKTFMNILHCKCKKISSRRR